MVYLILHFKVIVVIQGSLGQESRQEAGAEIVEEGCLLAHSLTCSQAYG